MELISHIGPLSILDASRRIDESAYCEITATQARSSNLKRYKNGKKLEIGSRGALLFARDNNPKFEIPHHSLSLSIKREYSPLIDRSLR